MAKALEKFILSNIKTEDDFYSEGSKYNTCFLLLCVTIYYQASTGYLSFNILYRISRQNHKLQDYTHENCVT